MPDDKPVYIISDAPELKSVEFGFAAYARTIADLIANKKNKTPLVIGVYGAWGSGKTTLMKRVKGLLESDEYTGKEKKDTYRRCKTVWFQAWKYDKEDEILAALIEEIFKAIKQDGSYARIKGELERFITGIDISRGVGRLAKDFIGLDVTDIFREPAYKAKLGFYDTFQEFFDRLVWTYTNLRPKFTATEEPDDQKGALVVFIDDLDRCPRPRIIKVLETIKVFMDKKGCVFVVGAANEIIEDAMKETYNDEGARRFMDKIVQVTFNIPQISSEDFESYMGTDMIDPDSREKIRPHLPYILATTRNNPRLFKRFLNDLSLMDGIHKNKETGIDYATLLFWKIVEFEAPGLVKETKENPQTLAIPKEIVADIAAKNDATGRWEVPAEKIKEVPQKSLHSYLENGKLTELITNMNVSTERVRQLISLSSIVKGVEPVEPERTMERELEPAKLHKLDEMVKIPAGPFKYGDDMREIEIGEPFEIDVYPVTNSQFRAFIADKGYEKDEYWTKEGIKWRDENRITKPRYRDEEKWNQPEHPVVEVSYFEADAFARWAGKGLPTEGQWERAARGTDGRTYPWGDEFDKERCNTYESGIGKTTRVTRYPNGISPEGCYDMAGNVWEWTDSWYDEEEKLKVVRGGSWPRSGRRPVRFPLQVLPVRRALHYRISLRQD